MTNLDTFRSAPWLSLSMFLLTLFKAEMTAGKSWLLQAVNVELVTASG